MNGELRRLVRASAPLMAALVAARALGLHDWCIGAGAVRNVVWDALHGFATPTPLDDIDLVHFERPATPGRDAALEAQLHSLLPGHRWEVTNQATVHEWAGGAPFASLREGIASWPEFATCVGVRLERDDALTIIAPYGLDDLFAMRIRHNTTRVSEAVFAARVDAKRWAERWQQVTVARG